MAHSLPLPFADGMSCPCLAVHRSRGIGRVLLGPASPSSLTVTVPRLAQMAPDLLTHILLSESKQQWKTKSFGICKLFALYSWKHSTDFPQKMRDTSLLNHDQVISQNGTVPGCWCWFSSGTHLDAPAHAQRLREADVHLLQHRSRKWVFIHLKCLPRICSNAGVW